MNNVQLLQYMPGMRIGSNAKRRIMLCVLGLLVQSLRMTVAEFFHICRNSLLSLLEKGLSVR
jgi:hypothetical protein